MLPTSITPMGRRHYKETFQLQVNVASPSGLFQIHTTPVACFVEPVDAGTTNEVPDENSCCGCANAFTVADVLGSGRNGFSKCPV
jgi:hypothetical protein